MTKPVEPTEDNALLSDQATRGTQHSSIAKFATFDRGGRYSTPLHNYAYGTSNPKLRPGVATDE